MDVVRFQEDTGEVGAGETDDATGAATVEFLLWVKEQFEIVEVVHTKDNPPWCPEWWKHPEAVARLDAAWQAFMGAGDSGLDGPSNWWLHHWDRHAAVLFHPQTGPFRDCDRHRGHLIDRDNSSTQVITPETPPQGWLLPTRRQ